jgi:hypothetical protein
MKIIFLEQENFSLFSPATGELLCRQDGTLNKDDRSLLGFWRSDKLDKPFIKDESLKKEWNDYLHGEGDYYPLEPGETIRTPEMDGFLWGCGDESSEVAFQIKATSQPEITVWLAVNMKTANEETTD